MPLRASPALVETDAVVTVTAAESVLHGGPAALLAAGGAEALRAANAESLLQTSGSSGWRLALAMERAVTARVPVIGLSLTLDRVRVSETAYGYPHDPASLERIARSPFSTPVPAPAGAGADARAQVAPPSARRLGDVRGPAVGRPCRGAAAVGRAPLGASSTGRWTRSASASRVRRHTCRASGRTRCSRRTSASAWRCACGGTSPSSHPAGPRSSSTASTGTSRTRRSSPTARSSRRRAAAPTRRRSRRRSRRPREDARSLDAYRAGHGCHPLLPFADWDGCQPQLGRLGEVLIAACRDSAAARQLGFVPTHAVGAALEMATGVAGGPPRIGFLLAPPYFPVRVGS